MPPKQFSSKGLRVPSSRLSRIARFGTMATGIAGGMLLDGALQIASGKRPSLGDLLLTPANAMKVTLQLGQMRGAAMKLGQLLSMDSGDFLPPELADILGRLRADAQHMPQRQLEQVLVNHWGKNWQKQFTAFDLKPIAAASIGQVHRAVTKDGREVAVKIQYPGVRDSVDSDVNNVATLLRLTNLLPATLDIAPVLEKAKSQLHEEADYAREGKYLKRFATLLAKDSDFAVPIFYPKLSGNDVLVMSYVDGMPIETLISEPQEERDRIMALLVELVLRELFEFGLMQTDPNFANYRYCKAQQKVALLDFGATLTLPKSIVQHYRVLLKMGLDGDQTGAFKAAQDIGFFNAGTAEKHRDVIEQMLALAIEMLAAPGPFDFGDTAFVSDFRDLGMDIAADRRNWHVPPVDTLFVQRKLGGMFLLASRLKARIDVRSMLQRFI
jgi:predicted unusual protein kinase regulating ubiquinone biosynthesis (AarF/ABC1/UbiB family)